MEYCSRSVAGQLEPIHPNLEACVSKHLQHRFQRPVQPYNQSAMAGVQAHWESLRRPPVILDSGCGTGQSTHALVERFPEHLVIGIDQSLNRLQKTGVDNGLLLQGRLCLIRADLVDCWRLIAEGPLPVAKHFILYPNPWPKKKHLQRRWHGHPVFKDLIQISPLLELRSNWKTYVDEFGEAVHLATSGKAKLSGTQELKVDTDNFLTPFEKKYSLSGQTLYQLTVEHITSC